MLLEDVFKQAGVPKVTFVEPIRYNHLRVSLRTPGRCAIIEGPSGIGKTSSVVRLIDELDLDGKVLFLSARVPDDIEYIASLPDLGEIGIAVIDDFHRLDDSIKERLADFMKVLADRGDSKSKVILIGINKAGDRLVSFGSDVGLRIDVFKLESNPPEKISELISLGEQALRIKITDKEKIISESSGSFQIAQMLCHNICVECNITETAPEEITLEPSMEIITETVVSDLRRIFHNPCLIFARGSKLRREGRAPYLHILKWLRDGDDWSIDLGEAIKLNPLHKGSVGQIITKGHLAGLMSEKSELLDGIFHFQVENSLFSIEDPKLKYYLRSINWRNFVREVGFTGTFYQGKYDVALSFAGAQRGVAETLSRMLSEREVGVFYDFDEQHNILAMRVEEYLGPIYRTEAAYVVPILSPEYPNRIWTKFESDQFKDRFGRNAVIPIIYTDAPLGMFDKAREYGGLAYDPSGDLTSQIESIVEVICKRLEGDRSHMEFDPTGFADHGEQGTPAEPA